MPGHSGVLRGKDKTACPQAGLLQHRQLLSCSVFLQLHNVRSISSISRPFSPKMTFLRYFGASTL